MVRCPILDRLCCYVYVLVRVLQCTSVCKYVCAWIDLLPHGAVSSCPKYVCCIFRLYVHTQHTTNETHSEFYYLWMGGRRTGAKNKNIPRVRQLVLHVLACVRGYFCLDDDYTVANFSIASRRIHDKFLKRNFSIDWIGAHWPIAWRYFVLKIIRL